MWIYGRIILSKFHNFLAYKTFHLYMYGTSVYCKNWLTFSHLHSCQWVLLNNIFFNVDWNSKLLCHIFWVNVTSLRHCIVFNVFDLLIIQMMEAFKISFVLLHFKFFSCYKIQDFKRITECCFSGIKS